MLSAVTAPNPCLAIKSREKQGSGSSSGTRASKDSNASASLTDSCALPTTHALMKAPCLFGLRESEAREFCERTEAEGGGPSAVGPALKKELDRRKAAYIRVVLSVAPCLGMTHANPAMQGEVWAMLSGLPYQDRFLLYGAWRGHQMERMALRVKHAQIVVTEVG